MKHTLGRRSRSRNGAIPSGSYLRLRAVVTMLIVLALFPPAAGAATASVSITSTLTPRDLTVAVGTDVTWTNNDGDRHRMRTTSGPVEFDSGNLDSGQTFAFTFDIEGTYLYMDDRNDDNSSYYGTVIVTSDGGGEPQPPPPPAPAGDVRIVDDTFTPGSITVDLGATVTWSNQDREHTVTARDRSWDSGIFDAGQTYSRTFDTAGTFEYFCVIHPEMVATVVVVGERGAPPPPSPPPPPPSPPPPPPPPPPAGASDVQIIDNDFDPAAKTVTVGSTVRWVNSGQLPHTVSAAGQFDSGFLMSGDTWSRTFNTAGTYDYICTLHPEMTATIVVSSGGEEPPPPSPPGEEPPPPSPPGEEPPPAPGAISIIDNDYQPATRTVAVGSTVRWVNNGQLPHTITVGGQFDSGFLMNGDKWSRTFNTAGTFNYICTIHPEMTGTIIVSGAAGGDSGEEAPNETDGADVLGPSVAAEGEDTAEAGPSTLAVAMIDNAYDPSEMEVRVGDSITWANTGELPHTVTDRSGSFDSGFLMTGDTWTMQFDQIGEFEYFCTIHPEMVGAISVREASADVAETGSAAAPASVDSDDTDLKLAGSTDPVAAGVGAPTQASIVVILLIVLATVGFIVFLVHEVDFAGESPDPS